MNHRRVYFWTMVFIVYGWSAVECSFAGEPPVRITAVEPGVNRHLVKPTSRFGAQMSTRWQCEIRHRAFESICLVKLNSKRS